ncbi:RNA polymerase sigma factor [Burkholderia pseudomultivorans]|uniref:RNA polymerase sigma factor, sigma-70 family protein n=2 Tax=Burkholderia cepacia complex TaxID=87882 RepID=A0AAN0RMV3_9BURK|nr:MULTISPECIES: RNA polymerase sigma factor [Burkholderia cepacia complex]AIO30632.1 RNA polymerase sigma factor, sigma-70 family protein [Burkholderia cenocepacia]EGD04200.1 sigma-24 (FecI-like) protein [Burkholderia sp. TJI49]AOI90393.1 RNA polymerase subunit sigma-24 [Burkholderia pseudomultivorans]KVC21389.1 RNA polymerase subunit sigma-24 [Burkholderia pseudomultivorans]KVC33411.1 RNA polymerase subunit sigma-24 [Burkholderia pseudomultivorans]
MTDSTRSHLKKLLESRYTHWLRRFERLVGTRDRAADLLHETWLKLENASVPGTVSNSEAYLMRMANNLAIDQHRRDQHYVDQADIDAVLEMPDDRADPERIVGARLTVDLLADVLQELPPRRRAILLAARVEGRLNREIAEQMGISLRLVELELRHAISHCLERMKVHGESGESHTSGRRKF